MRSHIIQQSAEVFNQFGYAGTSLTALMEAAGLKKGGIYNRKDEVEIAAFDYSAGLVQQRYTKALRRHRSSGSRLSVVSVSIIDNPRPWDC